jgi:hypothetical protein
MKNKFGFPAVYFYGIHGDYAVLVMDLLSFSLEDFLLDCGGFIFSFLMLNSFLLNL